MSRLTRKQRDDIRKLNGERKSYDQIAQELNITVYDVVRVLRPNL